jgi:hypothetical protein
MKHGIEIAEDEPLMKKQKTEESLEPEIQFMMKFNVNILKYISNYLQII